MEVNEEQGPGTEVGMNSHEAVVEKDEDAKPTYKSFKKKYRKMRVKFDEVMKESNNLCTAGHQAKETSARLAIEIDQILELLLDVNNSAQIPADKRINLYAETPALSPVPDLITSEELALAGDNDTLEGQAIYNEICKILDEKTAERSSSNSSESLASLIDTTPHLNAGSPNRPPDLSSSFAPLSGYTEPSTYLTLDAMDEYIYEIDSALGAAPPTPHHHHVSAPLDLALQNPHSVYNWLRRNEPKVFLQDGEGSEKSNGKPGSLRGAGKRSSMPAPSKPDALEIVEEDGIGYDPTIGGLEPTKGGKRKRDDDGGYHPKSGTPASGKVKKPRAKKVKVEGETSTPSSRKKAKPKERASSPMALDSETAAEA
ncbi:hypothetical protein D0Z07_1166 [Hyphodiscus hymeniophilus]|uniref:Uncharacterized protein n=1 Tax=Hyphodiscus hymeniophilus TaxID=353542 RepID=A0A9P7B008_9HELO|nr:hypothetical protein D0Z07_1166 [Hyphodiscus hymeniophilus]